MSHTLLSIIIIVVLLVLQLAAAATPPTRLCTTRATLLSGGLTSCKNITDSSLCSEGLSSAQAYIRHMRSTEGALATLLHYADRSSSFVQMHPAEWNVNALAYDRFGIPAFWSTPSLGSSRRNLTLLQNRNRPWIATNLRVEPDSAWHGSQVREYVDTTTGVGVLVVLSLVQPNSFDWVSSVRSGIAALRRDSRCKVVLLILDSEIDADGFLSGLGTTTAASRPDVIWDAQSSSSRASSASSPLVLPLDLSSGTLNCVDFDFSSTSSSSLTNASSRDYDLENLPSAVKDSQYYSDLTWFQQEADRASAFDPVVGYTTAMPFTRTGGFRMCMAGECELGNLWTDAIRWKFNVDVAFEPSGGIRGTGWPAGEVRLSDLFGALPFANQPCNGTIMGLRLFEIMNYSLALATFEGASTPTGDRLMQMSGMRVTFNSDLRFSRLLSMEILNRATNQYEPVERLKLYTFATNSFVCGAFAPFNTYFSSASYTGEVKGEIGDQLIQNIVAEYLTAESSASAPLQIGKSDRIVNDTTSARSTTPLRWSERQEDCRVDTYWDPAVATCQPCPAGEEQPNPGSTTCQPIEDYTILIIAVAIPVVAVTVILIILCCCVRSALKDVRDVANAPKDGRISLMFTDIQDSTKLWSTVPMSMSQALDLHHTIIREEIIHHKAYEVKTAGDSFMIAVSSETAAVALAMGIQRRLQASDFPASINQVYRAANDAELEIIDDDPSITANTGKEEGFNGLRVRVGIHSGEPQAVFDEVSKGYDYYGSPVNVAARVESIAMGGQVAVTNAVLEHLPDREGLAIRNIGTHELKGVPHPVECHEIIPSELSGLRVFVPKKRVGFGGGGGGGGGGDGAGNSNMGGGMSIAQNPFDDSAPSEVSETEVSETTADHVDFFKGMLRVLKPKDKKTIRQLLANNWRVPAAAKEGGDQNRGDVALVRRIQKAVKKGTISRSKLASHRPSFLNRSGLGPGSNPLVGLDDSTLLTGAKGGGDIDSWGWKPNATLTRSSEAVNDSPKDRGAEVTPSANGGSIKSLPNQHHQQQEDQHQQQQPKDEMDVTDIEIAVDHM